jgi:hypothetical protein
MVFPAGARGARRPAQWQARWGFLFAAREAPAEADVSGYFGSMRRRAIGFSGNTHAESAEYLYGIQFQKG